MPAPNSSRTCAPISNERKPRLVIVDLRGEHQFVRAGLIDDRLQSFAYRIAIADHGAGERMRDAVQLHLRRFEPFDRRLQLTGRAAPQVDELLLQRREQTLRFFVGIGGEQVDADHRVAVCRAWPTDGIVRDRP